MTIQRNYNIEIKDTADHQYAYSFDFDIMHPFMIRSFEPFFKHGNLLELGSFKGDFTKRFMNHFDDITCIEASGEALEEARQKVGPHVKFIHSLFENADLPCRYDNIILTHVLEHLDDPVRVLRRIHNEWLAEGGVSFWFAQTQTHLRVKSPSKWGSLLTIRPSLLQKQNMGTGALTLWTLWSVT